MERIIRSKTGFQDLVTDEIEAEAIKIADERMYSEEVAPRKMYIYDNEFDILCETRSEYKCFKFGIRNGQLSYRGYEGDFK